MSSNLTNTNVMRNIKAFLLLLVAGTAFTTADAQYYYGPPPGPPPPPPPHHREREQRQPSDDEGVSPTGYFGLSIGLAQPVGSFATAFGGTNTNSTSGIGSVTYPGGYAQPGFNFNISLGVPINHSNLGIAIMYGDCSNPFDIGAYTANVAATDPNKQYDGGDVSDLYSSSFIMVGLFATYPIQRLSLDLKVMGGVALTSTPEIAYSAQQWDATLNQYDQYSWDIASANSASFAFGLGADLRLKLRRVSLMLGVDFLTTTLSVNSQEQYTDPNNNTFYYRVGGSVPVSVVDPYIGIAYDIR
jgi:hypothetical protein